MPDNIRKESLNLRLCRYNSAQVGAISRSTSNVPGTPCIAGNFGPESCMRGSNDRQRSHINRIRCGNVKQRSPLHVESLQGC